MCRVRIAIVVGGVLVPGASFGATAYPCPSDPGFCYRDIGHDGCFDVGVDEGPINDEIQSFTTTIPWEGPPLEGPPGSVICPPSVEVLQRKDGDIVVITPIGSSIRFYGRPKIRPGLRLYSGGDILLQGTVEMVAGRCTPWCYTILSAEGDLLLEANTLTIGIRGNTYMRVRSSTGDVIVGPKTRHTNSINLIRAPAGNVTTLEKVKFPKGHLEVEAEGEFSADGLRVKSRLEGAFPPPSVGGLSLVGRVKVGSLDIDAGAGDVSTEGLRASDGSVVIAGHNITIGTSPTQRTRYKAGFEIDATGDVRILGLLQAQRGRGVWIETTGTLIEVLGSKMNVPRNRSFDITAGPGSTCDLTGTTFKNRSPDVRCDTVIGP